MAKSESIQVFDSQGEAYKRAFQIFLDHTDQKRNAKLFLQKLVDRLPKRNVFMLYYIPSEEWLAHLDRLVSWMSPTGVTVVVVQNRDTACMAMLDHFFGHRFDLQQLAQAFREKHGDRYNVVITLDPAHVETREPASAYAIAEFMLNLLPISRPPARRHVEDYLAKHCLTDGTYRLSVHQDFLQIRSR